METDRIDRFLDLYKRLEDALEEKYRETPRHYSSVIMEFIKDGESAPVREKLEVCRELRNLLTHSANLGGEPVACPSNPMVDAMEEVLAFATRPPMALSFATRGEQLMKANLDQRVLRLMETMDKNGYSHIPVLENGVFYGVFSAGSVFQYLLQNRGKGIGPNTTIRELKKQIDIREHKENYQFLPRNATYFQVREAFEIVHGKNKRVSAVFITENGRPGERLLGMLTPWDVLGE